MFIASIPGYNVSKLDKNKYAVAVNNGNIGACIMNEQGVRNLAQEKGGKIYDNKTLAYVFAGLGTGALLAATFAGRKNIGKVLEKVLGKVKDTKLGDFTVKSEEKIVNMSAGIGEKFVKFAKTAKDFFHKGCDFVVNTLVNIWNKTKAFVKKFIGKNDGQLEINFPKS